MPSGKKLAGSWFSMSEATDEYVSGAMTGRPTCARAPPPPTIEYGPLIVRHELFQ